MRQAGEMGKRRVVCGRAGGRDGRLAAGGRRASEGRAEGDERAGGSGRPLKKDF